MPIGFSILWYFPPNGFITIFYREIIMNISTILCSNDQVGDFVATISMRMLALSTRGRLSTAGSCSNSIVGASRIASTIIISAI